MDCGILYEHEIVVGYLLLLDYLIHCFVFPTATNLILPNLNSLIRKNNNQILRYIIIPVEGYNIIAALIKLVVNTVE